MQEEKIFKLLSIFRHFFENFVTKWKGDKIGNTKNS